MNCLKKSMPPVRAAEELWRNWKMFHERMQIIMILILKREKKMRLARIEEWCHLRAAQDMKMKVQIHPDCRRFCRDR